MSVAQKLGTSVVSAVALAALGVIPAAISVFMLAAMFGAHEVVTASGRTVTVRGVGSPVMLIVAVFLGVVGFFLLGAAVYTLVWGVRKSKQVEVDPNRDAWKHMPYPKD